MAGAPCHMVGGVSKTQVFCFLSFLSYTENCSHSFPTSGHLSTLFITSSLNSKFNFALNSSLNIEDQSVAGSLHTRELSEHKELNEAAQPSGGTNLGS